MKQIYSPFLRCYDGLDIRVVQYVHLRLLGQSGNPVLLVSKQCTPLLPNIG
jgi:hypothetical protein